MSLFLKNLNLSKIKNYKRPSKTTRQRVPSFPVKLYRMLEEVQRQGNENMVSWHPDGRSFRVHNPKKFVEAVLPMHFKQTKYKSFQRQLNFYGFQRVPSGPLEGSYGHPNFVRGNEELCKDIKRLTHHSDDHKQKISVPNPVKSYTEMTALSDVESTSSSPLDIGILEALEAVENSAPYRRESFQIFLDSNFGDLLESKRRESLREGKRLSFAGKNFFFSPVELTDLYGL
jgi:hypothetical protein